MAFITGGGTGLGRGMTRKFAELGGTVVISSRKQDVLEKTADELMSENPAGKARFLKLYVFLKNIPPTPYKLEGSIVLRSFFSNFVEGVCAASTPVCSIELSLNVGTISHKKKPFNTTIFNMRGILLKKLATNGTLLD